MEQIKQSSTYTLRQLTTLLEQLPSHDYALPLDILNQNTLGKHVRHIIEIYQALFSGLANGQVDYDNRARNLQLEINPDESDVAIQTLIENIHSLTTDTTLILISNQSYQEDCTLSAGSTLVRELIYCLEHAVHHMAILAIAVRAAMPHIQLHPHFGVAYSTVRHLEQAPVCVR